MRGLLTFLIVLAFICAPSAYAANNGYMEGHPIYNDDYYSPSYNQRPDSPNYDSDYYDRTYDNNNSNSKGYNDAPQGNDIRDHNPYYDRYGNLKD